MMKPRIHIAISLALFLLTGGASAQVPNLNAVQMIDATTGYIGGTGGTIFKSVNGGASWHRLTSSTSRSIYDVHFLNGTTGSVAGGESFVSANVISRTDDGGAAWTNQLPGVSTLLSGIAHLSSSTVLAVGNSGVILRTTDGGSAWSTVTSGLTDNLKKLSFVNSSTGYIAGWAGTILRTDDGGASWNKQSTGTTTILYDVDFVTANVGTAVGYAGAIFRTTNGGSTWSAQSSGTVESLYGVDFVDQNNGYAVGSTGAILKTTNGGSGWVKLSPGTYQNLNGVSFITPGTGIVVGSSQTILRTTDGGTTWTQAAMDSTTPSAPPAPALLSPSDAATGVVTNPTLSWGASAGATVYRLQVSRNSGFTDIVLDDPALTGTSRVVSGLSFGATYYWRVNAGNSGGTSPWSTLRSFTTEAAAQVTVQSDPPGRTFAVDGVAYTTSHTFTHNPGDNHLLAADSIQSEAGGGRFLWTSWSDGGALAHSIPFPGTDTVITVSFRRQFHLTMNSGAGGSVTPASAWHDSGTVVGITATPAPGYSFSGWSGTGAGSYTGPNNPASVSVNAAVTQAGSFTPDPVSVTVQTNPPGRTFSVDGTTYTGSRVFTWAPSGSHTLSVVSPQGDTATRYLFSGWSDGGAQSHSVSPGTDTTFTVAFTTQHRLTVEAAGPNGTVSPAGGWFDQGQVVQITATPDTGYDFAGWSGTGAGSYTGPGNPASVTMNAPVRETANFSVGTVPVAVTTFPAGRTVTVDGVQYTAPRTFNWTTGSSHTISADSLQAGATGVRYRWTGWSDAGARTHIVAPSGPATYTAGFATAFLLTVQSGPGGAASPATGWHDSATVVALSATPSGGYSFTGWSGSGPGSYTGPSNPVNVTLLGPVTETAGFTLTPVSVTVRSTPPDRSFIVDGTTYTATQTFTWSPADVHTLSVPSPQGDTARRYLFSGWSDGGAQTHTVSPAADTTFTVSFSTQYYLTTRKGVGQGSVSPASGWYGSGATVQISAVPDAAYTFGGWTGNGTGSYSGPNNPATVTMGGPVTETADFAPGPIPVTVTTNPSGLLVTVDGVAYTAPHAFTWTAGSSHTISADSLQNSAVPGMRYRWTAWSDAGVRSHTVYPVSGTTYTASFATQYQLTTSAGAGGSVTPGTGWYAPGRVVTVTALPDSGYDFTGWTGTGAGSYTGTGNPATVTISGPLTETAQFDPAVIPPPTVATQPAGSISSQSAVLNGQVNPNGDPTTAWFEWGTDSLLQVFSQTIARDAGSGNAPVAFGESLTGLAPDTRYYFRIAAHNTGGTEQGAILSFTTDTVALSGPEFAVTRSSIDFGTVLISQVKTDSIRVLNLGDSPLSVSGIITTSPNFDVSTASTNVPPGGSRMIYVTFAPDKKPSEAGWIIFTHNDPGTPDSVSLTGSGMTGGLPVVSLQSLTFVYIDSVGPQSLDLFVRNEGDLPIVVDTLETTNDLYSAEMPLMQVAPGDSQLVRVTCDPDTSRPGSGHVILHYDGIAKTDSVYVTYDVVLDAPVQGVLPGTFTLGGNYPNPFNPRTRIGYTLPFRVEFALKVFNMLGEEVATLAEGAAGPGEYSVDFDAQGLPSGVYFYRLVAAGPGPGGARMYRTGKMMLVR